MIQKEEILRQTNNGLEVFTFYMPFDFKLKKNFRNPLYDDHKASCQVYFNTNSQTYVMHDFGNSDYHGDCFWFVAKLLGLDILLDFQQVLKTIVSDLHLSVSSSPYSVQTTPPRQSFKRLTEKPITNKKRETQKMKEFKAVRKAFSPSELKYWSKYGIGPKILDKYEVVSLSEFRSITNEGKPFVLTSGTGKPMFGYHGKNYVKIYRPFEKLRFMYGGVLPEIYCFGIEQLPSRGDIVFITGGEKDTLTLASHGFNAICFNSETALIPLSIVEMLSRRFRHICVLFDCDDTGLQAMSRATAELSEFHIVTLQLPLSGLKTEKDISDYFAMGHSKEEFTALIKSSLQPLYSQSVLLIKTCEMNYNKPPERSKTVISAENVPLGTYDNLFCITGGEGTGKSNFVSSLIAGTLLTEEQAFPIDTLGFSVCPNFSHKAVLHFDTEQSEYQLYKNMSMTLRRSRLTEMPAFYHSFFLTTLSRKERIQLIRDSMDMYHNEHGGIHLVVIDGIADLVKSANDELESIAIVEELYRLAGIYHTCIICVLHFIPNGIKLRGHIGSELQRKSASILSVEKDDNPEYSVIKSLKVRDGNPLEVPMYLFKWDNNVSMHISAGKKSEDAKVKRKQEELSVIAKLFFAERTFATYKELVDFIVSQTAVADRTAKEYVSHMLKTRIIAKDSTNRYKIFS